MNINLKSKKLILIIAIIIVCLLAVWIVKITIFPSQASQILREFKGSYSNGVDSNGKVVKIDLEASPGQVTIAKDVNLDIWSYNKQIPGPQIRANLGDTIEINFINNLPQETTIHFHGIRVPNAMDGVPGVTQEPILPQDSFTYRFTPKDPGTYWYHPHVRGSEQVERGLYGTIVVVDPNEPVYDQDIVAVVDDWRLTREGQIDPRFNTGRDLMHDGRWGNLLTVNGEINYSVDVKPGERIRLRFVNTSNGRVYKLDFGDLKATGFAVDGLLAKEPFSAQGFEIAPGNRLDVDITIPSVSMSRTYVIRDVFTRKTYNLISLHSSGQVIKNKKNFDPPTAEVFPDWELAAQAPVDKEYTLNARRGGEFGIEWTINDKAYPNYDPILLKYNEFNKIRIVNGSARLHPMHLHGQFFKVIARNGKAVNEPYWRDTVLLRSRETIDIGLVPLDKGNWANHCHILEHAEAGMMTVVEVR